MTILYCPSLCFDILALTSSLRSSKFFHKEFFFPTSYIPIRWGRQVFFQDLYYRNKSCFMVYNNMEVGLEVVVEKSGT